MERIEGRKMYYYWPTFILLSTLSAAEGSKLKTKEKQSWLRETAGGKTFKLARATFLSLRTAWEQSVQSVHRQRQITLAQCSKLYFILKPVTSAFENKWQVYLH